MFCFLYGTLLNSAYDQFLSQKLFGIVIFNHIVDSLLIVLAHFKIVLATAITFKFLFRRSPISPRLVLSKDMHTARLRRSCLRHRRPNIPQHLRTKEKNLRQRLPIHQFLLNT